MPGCVPPVVVVEDFLLPQADCKATADSTASRAIPEIQRRLRVDPAPSKASPEIGSHMAYQNVGALKIAPVLGGAVVLSMSVEVTTGLVAGMLGTGLGLNVQVAPVGRPAQAKVMGDGYCGLPFVLRAVSDATNVSDWPAVTVADVGETPSVK